MHVTLQVGERRFITSADTLTHGSDYFSSLLSGQWNNAQADGSYFIDADPDLFEHILRYLRRGVLPIFYDKLKGHDYGLYAALWQEARYFQIPRLQKWIEEKEYLKAVKIVHSYRRMEVDEHQADYKPKTMDTSLDVEYHPMFVHKNVYECYDCRAFSNDCDRCEKEDDNCKYRSGEEEGVFVDKVILMTLVVEKQVIFDPQACVEAS